MKKKLIFLPILGFALFFSCSSKTSFETDVRKMARYRCEMKKLLAMDPDDVNAAERAKKLRKEMEDFSEKMLEKYKDRIDDKKMEEDADRITEDEMRKCN